MFSMRGKSARAVQQCQLAEVKPLAWFEATLELMKPP
jgi:hypothetical protein